MACVCRAFTSGWTGGIVAQLVDVQRVQPFGGRIASCVSLRSESRYIPGSRFSRCNDGSAEAPSVGFPGCCGVDRPLVLR